jgi:hypothetical protein
MNACFGLSRFSRPMTAGALVLVAVVALSGCQSMKRTLGIKKTVPDEFAVASPAPLSIPPDYNLRPPAPGEDRTQTLTAAEQARAALVGRARIQAYQTRGMSRGEATFLAHAGADEIQPDIRTTLDKEVSVFAGEEKSFTDKLVFWRTEDPAGTLIDPAAEAKRLSQNAATGKKPNVGPIPVISKGNTSFLGIF